MKVGRQLLICLLTAVFIFGWFSWPLYKHFNQGIAHTAAVSDSPPARYMVQGDHLQLLHYFWLASDWIRGKTPIGYNPYIFNTGDEEATACPTTDYMPFTGFFAILHLFFSRATSWNLTILAVIWISIFFVMRLVQVYGANERQAFLLALIFIGIPYQWTALFGGSPTGFAMMSVPMILYGMERMIRSGSYRGSAIAVAGLLAAFWTDTHVLLFMLLLAPAWGILILVHDTRFPWTRRQDWIRRAAASAPLAITALSAIILRMRTKAGLADSTMAAGRELHEVSLFSPHPAGLVSSTASGHDHTIYLGAMLLLLLGIGLVVGVVGAWKERNRRKAIHILLLTGGVTLLISFALGVNGPLNAKVLTLARRLLPPMSMIRQPAKIFGILYPVAAILAIPAMRLLDGGANRLSPIWRSLPALIVTVVLFLNLSSQIRPGICLLEASQSAYAAVAVDTPDAAKPRALALPIWPGDSSWSSLYQYYASLHRIRLVNGYLPMVAQDYIDSVYIPLDSVNTGQLNTDQINLLASMGVKHLLLHENAYPEQVSWFPVGATLQKFLKHPRLQLLKQDGPVWSFRILDKPREQLNMPTPQWPLIGSRIQSEIEHEHLRGNPVTMEEENTSNGQFIRLSEPEDGMSMGAFNHQEAPNAILMIRLRGNARWTFELHNDERVTIEERQTDEADWTWVTIPLNWEPGTTQLRPALSLTDGQLDLDRLAYISGRPPSPQIGEQVIIPAGVLFHAGYTDLTNDAVVLRPDYEPTGRIVYGPRWPLPRGRYQAALIWATQPAADKRLGQLELKMGRETVGTVDYVGTNTPPLEFSTQELDLPLEFGFYYERQTTLRIRGIHITRME